MPLLVERLLRFVEQADVLDRDRRLVGECRQQRNLALGELPHLLSPQENRPERLVLPDQRNHGDGAMALPKRNFPAPRVLSPSACMSRT